MMASNDSGVDTSNDSNDGGVTAVTTNSLTVAKTTAPTTSNAMVTASVAPLLTLPLTFQLNFQIPKDGELPKFVFPDIIGNIDLDSSIMRSSSPAHHRLFTQQRLRLRAKARYPYLLASSHGRKLRTAASTNNLELLSRLLEGGTDPDCSDAHKRSPLHLAACRGYHTIVSQLLKYGANPNVVDSLGNTPLHLAVISASTYSYYFVVGALLQHGAHVHVLDRSGKTPHELAESKLRLMRTRYHSGLPASTKILDDICLLTTLLSYLVKKKQDVDDLSALEMRLKNLTTDDQIVSEADSLLASVERLSITK